MMAKQHLAVEDAYNLDASTSLDKPSEHPSLSYKSLCAPISWQNLRL